MGERLGRGRSSLQRFIDASGSFKYTFRSSTEESEFFFVLSRRPAFPSFFSPSEWGAGLPLPCPRLKERGTGLPAFRVTVTDALGLMRELPLHPHCRDPHY